jgi:hypothetical protein
MRVYLSSPYETNRAEQTWKSKVLNSLHKMDGRFTTIDPCPGNCLEHDIAEAMKQEGDWLGFYSFCANIVEGDFAMLDGSQGMFAYLPKDSVTFGTTDEISYALNYRIPVVLVMPEGIEYVSRWLWGRLGPQRIFDNVEEAATVLAKRILVANGDDINGEIYNPSWQKASR